MVRYDPVVHRSAKRELDELDDDARERLTDVICAVAENREPSSHDKARHLEGHDSLFRVRVGDTRAICELQSPELRVLRVGRRTSVYDIIDDIDDRREAVV